MKVVLAVSLGLLVLLRGSASADDLGEAQRLIPWPSLAGRPHPDEANLDSAEWTSVSRQTLPPRLTQRLNQNWTFNYFPAEQLDQAQVAPAADDSRWPVVSLPHTWSTFETTRAVHPFIARPSERANRYWWYGWGIYRKSFSLDPSTIAGKKVFVEFDGVMKYCRVFLNGQQVGDHKGGYASFCFDLTPDLRPGVNTLAVAVSARRDDPFRIPPMTAGNFDVYGGIYRDVRLVVKNPTYIPFQGSADHEGGTFVTTPQVSDASATVRVRTWVKNDEPRPRTVTLKTSILDPAGALLIQDEVTAQLAPGESHKFDQPALPVDRPRLWSPQSPTLYRVDSSVRIGGAVVDCYASPLGFRWFRWNNTENRGYLNGQLLHVHGTNRHQEFPWLGDAVPKWVHVRDLADIRFGLNHNFLRTAHYTQDSLVYDLTDRYGILVCEEVPNIKDIDFSTDVQRQQVIEMIRRDRNHPSIVMWSMGNETSHPADSSWAHEEDTTRILHLRHGNLKAAGPYITHTDKQMDMENLLRCTVRGWTNKDVADFQPVNGQGAGTEAWQHDEAMIQDASQRGRIDMPNGVMWIYADHGADRQKYFNCPIQNLNPKGWTDPYRIPKYIYRLWQANYATEPMVFVQPHFWQSRYLGQRRDFVVDSNCDSVELFVNNRSVGTLKPGPRNFWSVIFKDVLVEPGELRVVGIRGERNVTSQVLMASAPARLTLTSSHPGLIATRDSVALLTADVVDANGVLVQQFSRDLHWELSGPATLLTPDVYTTDMKRLLAPTGTYYIVLPVCSLIRSTGEPGAIVATVKADGLQSASVTIPATAPSARSGFVTEPAPSPANRLPVAIAPATTDATRRPGRDVSAPALPPVTEDLTLAANRDRAFYGAELRRWFAAHEPRAMKHLAFDELVDVFAEHLVANGGVLVADDFNQRAQQFNDVCTLESAIAARHLPESFAVAAARGYARRALGRGEPLQFDRELKWIEALPDVASVEVLSEAASAPDLFDRWYPGAAQLTAEQRGRAFDRFRAINSPLGSPRFDGPAQAAIRYPAQSPLLRPGLEQLLHADTPNESR